MHQVLTQEEAKEPSEGPLGHAHAKWMEEKINKSGPEDDPPFHSPLHRHEVFLYGWYSVPVSQVTILLGDFILFLKRFFIF